MKFNKNWFYTLTLSSVLLTGGVIAPPTHAQKVVNTNPAVNSRSVSPETSISGVFDTTSGEVNSDSVEIYLNGKNITNQSTITENFFSYKPPTPLSLGNNKVRVEYENKQGLQRVVSWNFNVENSSAKLEIDSITHNATDPLGKGSTFLATMKGTRGSTAKILLMGEDGRRLVEIPAQEVSEGVYVGTYNLLRQSRADEGIVVGSLEKNNQTVYGAATEGFAFNNQTTVSEAPQVQETSDNNTFKPMFTNYENGDRISTQGFTLQGETLPNATVEVEVSSKMPVLGGIINIDLGGNTFFEQKVTADKEGNFQVLIPAPGGLASGMKYTVKAIAFNQNKASQPAELTLIQK